ncbi:MAG: hypothetical protein E6767_20740, partial [Dysgonomonas sp.]|nr:hypothetical protein [Dysgonomonas sp.]
STAAASIGTNSNIDLSGGTVEFDGSGYAVYSDGTGKIDLSGSTIILGGKSTAFDLDLGVTSPIKLDSNSKINVVSDEVVVFNLQNVTGLSTNNLEGTITSALGTAIGGEIDLDKLLEDSTATNYKTAAVDGGEIVIGDLDKTGTGAGSDTQAQKDGNFYYNRFLGQRLAGTATGSTISAVLNNTQASKFNNQVVGLEMNSSKLAVSNTETGINLVNSTIIADRDGAGTGAIGAFINYGVVTIDGTSSIKVEKESNAANAQAVGIYAVNGSDVSNAGNIEVGGNQSIGILGMAYREDSNSIPIVNEFGSSAVDQGKVNIINTGNITLDGVGTIGIYADNNNSSGAVTDTTVSNAGNIIIGDSNNSNAAVGIYGKKATISNTGNITTGTSGVAIYATEGSNITSLGTLTLGSDGVGVMLNGKSEVTATTLTLNGTGTPDVKGKTGIFYRGTGTETKNINVAVNASALDKGTAVYVEDMNVESSGALSIGISGVGIFVKETGANTGANTGTNKGTIDLASGKTGAVGMYTKTSNIVNDISTGIININDASQIGMYAEGMNSKAINKGKINLKVDSSTGIYVKDKAVAELAGTGNSIVFGGKSSVGVFAEGATVAFKDNLTFTNNNENKNIYVYGKDSTVEIDTGKTISVDGGTIPTAAGTEGNKIVGIYLENAGTGSTFSGKGNLTVKNGAVGIYSKGNNYLDVNVTTEGDKTTGIFIDGESRIKGTVAATAGAIGVYGSGGAVSIDTGLTLNIGTAAGTANKGTGMYLTDGAYATGGKITVNNSSTTNNIGVYYSKGAAQGTVTNGAEIELAGTKSIGIYAADGITLVNNSNITSTAGKSENIGSYVGGGSQLTSTGTITMNDAAGGIGIYTEEGKGINSGTIRLNGTAGSMVGMVAEAQAGKTAVAENASGGVITAGANLGMYIGGLGASSGINAGTITAATGTG